MRRNTYQSITADKNEAYKYNRVIAFEKASPEELGIELRASVRKLETVPWHDKLKQFLYYRCWSIRAIASRATWCRARSIIHYVSPIRSCGVLFSTLVLEYSSQTKHADAVSSLHSFTTDLTHCMLIDQFIGCTAEGYKPVNLRLYIYCRHNCWHWQSNRTDHCYRYTFTRGATGLCFTCLHTS